MLENEQMLWYVVHTYSGYENKVKTSLEKTVENLDMYDYIEKIVIPVEYVAETKNDGKKKVRERKIFPGYILIKMKVTDKAWYLVRNTKGVTGFVGTNNKPIPLTPDEVYKMHLEDEISPDENIREEVDFEVGDTVLITGGEFSDREATISEIMLDKRSVKVNMIMFDRETEVEFDIKNIKKIENGNI